MTIKTPKTINICAKCSDMCNIQFIDADGTITEQDGYVPAWLSPNGYGDYVELEIDAQTGRIRNWKAPTVKEIMKIGQYD